jgi:hypothetical protein
LADHPPRRPSPGAVEAAVAGGLFDRAAELAAGSPQLARLVEEAHTGALVAANDADALAARGNAAAAVEMFVARGNWERAHELVGWGDRVRGAGPGQCV